ncbi:Aldehyde oxidase and xanthine dehydrogenase, molybdopterin binding domain protein [Verrucomicrobiia bacterium DG1235]|nr:Aldehyde oxidase and xanthine dehydrogenase, molybdopterin binding domain protein [Verrucomicrobiae bacterium DG1235]
MTVEASLNSVLPRRSFLKTTLLASGAFLVGVAYRRELWAGGSADEADWSPNLYLRIDPDNTVFILSKNPECGQGVKTALPMIVAECLEVDWEQVRVDQAGLDDRLGRQAAAGSGSTPDAWNDLRVAGTGARVMLVAAAAEKWSVAPSECVAREGRVLCEAKGLSARYGDLLKLAAKQAAPNLEALSLVSKPKDFKLLGRRIAGVDNAKIHTGKALFGCDTRLEGMLYAVYVKCPSFGGRVNKANVEQVLEMPGVTHAFVVEGGADPTGLAPGVAIVAETWWEANAARRYLRVDWETAQSDSSYDYERQADALRKEAGETLREDGQVEEAFGMAERIVEGSYYYPFVSHAPMEPQNCTALYHDSGRIELWAPTQLPGSARDAVSRTLGLKNESIQIHMTRMGGGFGRRLVNEFAAEVAWIAREVRRPVQLQWTREDDMSHDFYRPAGWHDFKAGLDEGGRMVAWDHHFVTFGNEGRSVSGAGISRSHYPAGLVENFRLRQSMIPCHVPTGPWRSPGHSAFCWAFQSFFDDVCDASGRDPLEFRMELLSRSFGEPPLDLARTRATLKLAAEKAGWGRELGEKRGMGLAFHFDHGGFATHIAEVSVGSGGRYKVDRVVSAIDVGPVLNRSGAENQVEGCVVDALSTCSQLEIEFIAGTAKQSNFRDYPLLRIDQTPTIECHFIESDNPPSGLGEPPFAPVAPAIANALFAATGRRVREMPFVRAGFSI